MSRLRAILDDISNVEATIAQIERDADPDTLFADKLMLQSLEKRREILTTELADATKEGFVEVCDYRLIPDSGQSYALSAVTGALGDFQELVTTVYDAIVSGKPKERAKFDADVVEKTRFDWGFSYAGSIGVALVIENDRLLAVESNLDRAIGAVFDLLKVDSVAGVHEAATQYGTATVRKLHTLSKTHRDYGLSAEIKWVRDRETKNQVLTQPQEFSDLCSAIEARGDKKSEPVTITGLLVSWNTVGRTFILVPPEAEPIKGSFSKDFDASIERNVPHRHQASLTKLTVYNFVSGDEETSWVLDSIEKLN